MSLFRFPMVIVNNTDFHSHHAHHRTQIKLDVWHKSQSKAKSRKRRHLVASATMPLGEAMKRQGTDPCEYPHDSRVCRWLTKFLPPDVELRLSGVPAARKKSVAQKHQPCASLLIRIRPPSSAVSPSLEQDNDDDKLSLISSGVSCPSFQYRCL